jgi:hypothetical protein
MLFIEEDKDSSKQTKSSIAYVRGHIVNFPNQVTLTFARLAQNTCSSHVTAAAVGFIRFRA